MNVFDALVSNIGENLSIICISCSKVYGLEDKRASMNSWYTIQHKEKQVIVCGNICAVRVILQQAIMERKAIPYDEDNEFTQFMLPSFVTPESLEITKEIEGKTAFEVARIVAVTIQNKFGSFSSADIKRCLRSAGFSHNVTERAVTKMLDKSRAYKYEVPTSITEQHYQLIGKTA